MEAEEFIRQFLQESDKSLNPAANMNLAWDTTHGVCYEIVLPVISRVSPEFTFRITYNPLVPDEPTMGIYYEVKHRAFGLDINGAHKEFGKVRKHTHFHQPWTKRHGDSQVRWVFDCPPPIWEAVNYFLDHAKIVRIPEDWWSYPPGAVVSNRTFWNS